MITLPGITKNSIVTFTGKVIEPLDPKWDSIDIKDIAHALSNECRYAGHCREFYSVAQHSVYVSYNVPKEDMLNGLLHDASEAYLGDVPRPMKRHSNYAFYRETEEFLQTMIYQKFGTTNLDLDKYESLLIKKADTEVLEIEQTKLFDKGWTQPSNRYLKYKEHLLIDNFTTWSPVLAEKMFLDRFKELGGEYEG